MIAQRLRQTFTGSHCRVPREPGPLLEVPGFRFLEVVPAVALGRDTHGRNVTELRRLAAFSEANKPTRKRLGTVVASQDHQTHVETQDGQRRPPDPPWPQRTRTNGERSRPIDRRTEPARLAGNKPGHLPLTLKTHAIASPCALTCHPVDLEDQTPAAAETLERLANLNQEREPAAARSLQNPPGRKA